MRVTAEADERRDERVLVRRHLYRTRGNYLYLIVYEVRRRVRLVRFHDPGPPRSRGASRPDRVYSSQKTSSRAYPPLFGS